MSRGMPGGAVSLWQVPAVRYGAYLALWLAVFFAGAWPAWKAAYRNADRIEETSARIEALTSMASAGAWFNAVAARWEPVQREQYERLFPPEKDRELLFLQVAQMARQADIDPFELREIPIPLDPAGSSGVDPLAMSSEEEELALLVEQFATDTSSLPRSDLHSYRLQAVFQADYARVARFLAHLQEIPRALTVHSLSAVDAGNDIRVTLELEFYAQPALQS